MCCSKVQWAFSQFVKDCHRCHKVKELLFDLIAVVIVTSLFGQNPKNNDFFPLICP